MSDDLVIGGILPIDDGAVSANDPDAIESDFFLDDENALEDGAPKGVPTDEEEEDLFEDE